MTVPFLYLTCALSLMTGSYLMLDYSCMKRIRAFENTAREKCMLSRAVSDIEENIQSLKESLSDTDASVISSLVEGMPGIAVTASDASTALNRSFASPAFLESSPVRKYIDKKGEDAFTEYGWINPVISGGNLSEGFPISNALPCFNIHFMDPDFLRAVLEYSGIKEPEKKAALLTESLDENTSVREAAQVLGISEGHPFFRIAGFKTLFWKVELEAERLRVSAVFAAVPEKESQEKIEKYVLVERHFSYK